MSGMNQEFDPMHRAGELWLALVNDIAAKPCKYPCLRDDLTDWLRDHYRRSADLRARLSLEQRDEPRERGYSIIDDDSGLPNQGELP